MPKAAKMLAAMRRNPSAGWRMSDVEKACAACSIACVPPTRGSHYRIAHPSVGAILTIPARRPIKPVYIRLLVAYIDQVEAAVSDG